MFKLMSEKLGLSTLEYETPQLALEAGRIAWKRNPARVGMCYAVHSDLETYATFADFQLATRKQEWLSQCNCADEVCSCGIEAFERMGA